MKGHSPAPSISPPTASDAVASSNLAARPLSQFVRKRRTRMVAYLTRHVGLHVVLLLGVWLFLFLFFWMLATSVKTDEELAQNVLLPQPVSFHACGPYVRPETAPLQTGRCPVRSLDGVAAPIGPDSLQRHRGISIHSAPASFDQGIRYGGASQIGDIVAGRRRHRQA